MRRLRNRAGSDVHRREHLRVLHPDTDPHADPDPHSDPDPHGDSNADEDSHPDCNSHARDERLLPVCRKYLPAAIALLRMLEELLRRV